MKKVESYIRVNGRGNAWPVFLGGTSKFYHNNSTDLSNASFSIINREVEKGNEGKVLWEVLIDAGNHTVPFLIQNGNRIPEAVVLTHGHMDHTLGLDWVAQSQYYLSNKSKLLKLYATKPVWEFVVRSYPHLQKIIDFKELVLSLKTKIEEVKGLYVTAFPVFHGEHARGASLLYFELPNAKSVVITGDMLCPLIRKKDMELLSNAQVLFIDSNNRYPYPGSNHGSVVSTEPNSGNTSVWLQDWKTESKLNYLIAPHARSTYNSIHHEYFDEFLTEHNSVGSLPYSVFDFCKAIGVPKVALVHYGGMEDLKYYKEQQVSAMELRNWVKEEAKKDLLLAKVSFIVPEVGDKIVV